MRKKLFAGLMAAVLALSACGGGAGSRAEDPAAESAAEGTPVTEDTIESAGVSAFINGRGA